MVKSDSCLFSIEKNLLTSCLASQRDKDIQTALQTRTQILEDKTENINSIELVVSATAAVTITNDIDDEKDAYSIDSSSMLSYLGSCHYYLAEYEQAELCYKLCLKKRRSALGSTHSDTLLCLYNLGKSVCS